MPNKILFSWLARPRACCGPRKRWRDAVKKDLQAAGISTQLWYKEAQDRRQWHRKYSTGALNHQQSLRDKGGMKTRVWSVLFVDRSQVAQEIQHSVRRRERSQFASREVLYSVQYVNDGLRVEEVSQFIAVNLAQVKYRLRQFHRCPGVKYVRGHLADHKT